MKSDRDLLEAWRDGDAKAGETLFDRHFDRVYRFFQTKVDRQDVDDLVQQTFMGCVQSRERFRGESQVGTYLLGIAEIAAIIGIAGANVAMILFGWLQERFNAPDRTETTMMPFWFGTVAGVIPWLAIWFNVLTADEVPGFVYGIVVAETVLFFSFGLNQWLQYRRVGRWADYLVGEKRYLVLSLVAKSLLAWQIYGGSLAPDS